MHLQRSFTDGKAKDVYDTEIISGNCCCMGLCMIANISYVEYGCIEAYVIVLGIETAFVLSCGGDRRNIIAVVDGVKLPYTNITSLVIGKYYYCWTSSHAVISIFYL